jgi:phosphohistidine phosphatase
MRLFLAQHGDAVSKDVDPQRPLSEKGRVDVGRMASFLSDVGISVGRVVHSGKRRAEETAELLAASIPAGPAPEQLPGIGPLDPLDEFVKTLNEWTEDTMVVGHLPFMAKLISRLTVGPEVGSALAFQPGTVACLERAAGEYWSLMWMVRPELLPGAAREKS